MDSFTICIVFILHVDSQQHQFFLCVLLSNNRRQPPTYRVLWMLLLGILLKPNSIRLTTCSAINNNKHLNLDADAITYQFISGMMSACNANCNSTLIGSNINPVRGGVTFLGEGQSQAFTLTLLVGP